MFLQGVRVYNVISEVDFAMNSLKLFNSHKQQKRYKRIENASLEKRVGAM